MPDRLRRPVLGGDFLRRAPSRRPWGLDLVHRRCRVDPTCGARKRLGLTAQRILSAYRSLHSPGFEIRLRRRSAQLRPAWRVRTLGPFADYCGLAWLHSPDWRDPLVRRARVIKIRRRGCNGWTNVAKKPLRNGGRSAGPSDAGAVGADPDNNRRRSDSECLESFGWREIRQPRLRPVPGVRPLASLASLSRMV
jgi:hypothetical protein